MAEHGAGLQPSGVGFVDVAGGLVGADQVAGLLGRLGAEADDAGAEIAVRRRFDVGFAGLELGGVLVLDRGQLGLGLLLGLVGADLDHPVAGLGAAGFAAVAVVHVLADRVGLDRLGLGVDQLGRGFRAQG